MGGGGGAVKETSQQIALAERAAATMADYRQRWLPIQKQIIGRVKEQGAEGSAARKGAVGRATTDIEASFGQARGALEKGLSNRGVAPGSSRSNLAVTGMGADIATSKGMSSMISNQQVDDAYMQGLNSLVQIGQGKAASANQGLADQARMSGMQAQADAQASLTEQQGYGQAAGTVIGYGLQSAMAPSAPPGGLPSGSTYNYRGTDLPNSLRGGA